MRGFDTIDSKGELPGFVIERTIKKMKHSFAKILSELNADFTVDQWIVLQILYKNGPLNQFEIADIAVKDRPTITRIIDILADKSLLIRKPDKSDRRRFMIQLTGNGKKAVESIHPEVVKFRRKAYQGLSEPDMQKLKSIMDKIHKNLTH